MTSIIPVFMGIILYYFISDVTQMVKAKSKDKFNQLLKNVA